MIRVLIVEDNRPYADRIGTELERSGGIKVLAKLPIADLVVRTALDTNPDVVLLNLILPRSRGSETPEICGVDVIRELMADLPDSRIVVHTAINRPELIEQAREAGAAGYLPKSCPPEELIDGIQRVAAGGTLWVDIPAN